MFISQPSSLFGLSKKPFVYVLARNSAGANGSPASLVKNQAGSQSTADTSVTPKMKYAALNGHKSYEYDASKVISLSSPSSAAGSITVVAVEKRTTSGANYFFCEHGPNASTTDGFYAYGATTGAMGMHQGGQPSYGVPTVSANWILSSGTWYTRIWRCDHTNQLYKFRVNGTDVPNSLGVPSTWGAAAPLTAAFHIGRRVGGAADFRGECALVAAYSGYLSDAECVKVETILRRMFKHY